MPCSSYSGTRSTSGTPRHRRRHRGETITGNGIETVSAENEGTEIDMDRCRQERIIHHHRREMGQSWRIGRRIR